MSHFLEKPHRAQQGATLVELLVALLIAGLVFAGVYQIYTNSVRTASVQDQVTDMQENARVVMDQIMRELRMAGYDPTKATGTDPFQNLLKNPIQLASGDQLILQGDFDGDGKVDTVTYAVGYDVKDTAKLHPWLTRQFDGVPDPAAKFGANIEDLIVTFYDADNCKLGTTVGAVTCPTITGSAVKRVTLQLTARTDGRDKDFTNPNYPVGDSRRTDGYRRRTVESDAVLRNMGQNVDKVPPNCPKNVVAATTGDCRVIRVTWTRPDDTQGDLAGYYIYYDQNPINVLTSSFVDIVDIGPNPGTYQKDITVPSGGTGIWNVAVTSYDRSGNLCDNNPGNGNPPADPVPATGSPVNINLAGNKQPASPGNAVALPADNQVTVSWGEVLLNTDGSQANDLVGYRLYRSTQSNMSGAVQIADEFALPITQVLGGGINHTTQYIDNDADTIINGSPAGAKNCQIYYYQVTVVDQCGLESAPSTVQSLKPDGTFSVGVTPPDNGKAPPAPTITSLLAGDDTSSIIVNWTVPVPTASQSTPVGVKIYWRVKGTVTWNPIDPPVDVPITILPATGQQIINGLSRNTYYDVKVSSYDDSTTQCGDASDSSINTVFTGACAPKINSHKIVPGISSTGASVPLDGTAVIGSLSPSANRYVTWVVDPWDCTPDSSNFAPKGYDYKNPPAYDSVAYDPVAGTSARVEFYTNDSGGADQRADIRYGTTDSGSNPGNVLFPSNGTNADYAPRGGDSFYHFPADPLSPSHLDTSVFCDAQYDFKVIAWDGEQYNANSTIRVTISNGGITVDPSVTVTSDISSATTDDTHHVVRFGIQNSNAALDLKLNKITLAWGNNSAFLEKLEVLDSNKNLIGKWDSVGGSPTGLVGIGTQLTLNQVPTLKKAGSGGSADKGYIRLTFKNNAGAVTSNVDMRDQGAAAEETTTITKLEQQDASASGSSGICSITSAGSANVHMNPTISQTGTVMNQPFANTVPSQTRGAIVVPSGQSVTVTSVVTPETGVPISSVKVYYNVDSNVLATAPSRSTSPTVPGSGGPNYPGTATGTYDSVAGQWNIPIPSNPDRQIWFYLEAMDGTVSDPFNRNFDLYPDQGVFTYVQCGTSTPTVTITTPSGGSASGNQIVNVTVGTAIPLLFVKLTVTDNSGFSGVPDFTGTKDMCFGTNNVCSGTPNGTSEDWTTSYAADQSNPAQSNVKHTITVTARNVCNNDGTATKNLN